MALAFLLLLTAFCFLLKNLLVRNKKLRLPPGPRPWPIVGCLPSLHKNKPRFRWIHQFMAKLDTEIACMQLGSVHVFVVTSPEIAREFLKTHDSEFTSRPMSPTSRIITRGYLTTALGPYGDQWKKMRRVISSDVLSTSKFRWLQQKRAEETDHLVHLVNHLRTKSSNGLVNVRYITRHYCGNVIRSLLFGKRYFSSKMKNDGPGNDEEEHVEAIFTALELIFNFSMPDYIPSLAGFDLDGHQREMQRVRTVIDRYHDPIIHERLRKRDENESSKREDLLDILVHLKDAEGKPLLSAEEIKAQVTELMMATVDNPSNAVEWALAEMLNQPHILEKAVAEIDQVVGRERVVQEKDIPQLNYVKAILKEAFRLHPIAPFNLPHVAMVDTTVAGFTIPKGSHLLLSRIGLGRNPSVWDRPLRFDPERHLKGDICEVVLTDQMLNMLSFSTGRRGCVGITLGSTMTVILLATLLQAFTWTVPPEVNKINLDESKDNLFLAKPLLACATPRKLLLD